MSARRIACFAHADRNHFGGLIGVVRELVRAGAEVRVWTDAAFAADVATAGAAFADLDVHGALADVDDTSRPLPSRFVTFAAEKAAALADDVRAWGADLILHDSFALVGRLVAETLGRPHVSVMAGHAFHGATFRNGLAEEYPRVVTDPRCLAAVRKLRDGFGLRDASPFSYVPDPSPHLNVSLEPAEWLDDDETRALSPFVSFGWVSSDDIGHTPARRGGDAPFRLYFSLGTIIWRYWAAEALALMEAVGAAVDARGDVEATFSLGGAAIGEADRARLARWPQVTIEDFVDQRALLAKAHLFLTHQGAASTHEAASFGVPMLSAPFFADQPVIAARAQAFGIATPIAPGFVGRQSRIDADTVAASLEQALSQRAAMRESLELARSWERRTAELRPEAAQRILAVAG